MLYDVIYYNYWVVIINCHFKNKLKMLKLGLICPENMSL
jgi:hypothetical protein